MYFSKKLLFLISITTLIKADLWFDIVPIKELIKECPTINYQKCFDKVPFDFEKFGADPSYPNKGNFTESFIITIPHGKVQSLYGYTLIDNHFIKEMVWADQVCILDSIKKINTDQVIKVTGKVAVITQVPYYSYAHWLTEVLGRLALLEMSNIEYDWLYVPYNSKFIKESLRLWGIDPAKIISPDSDTFCIEAEELIVPSLVINTDVGFKHFGLWTHPYTVDYIKNKLSFAAKQEKQKTSFSKRIFISRRDGSFRRILNEDDVFELFKAKGFERYELSKMSMVDQILLFHNADIVAGEHGAGLTNIIYCKPQTKVIEIFQALKDATFWYHANVSRLQYTPVKTVEFGEDYMTAWQSNMDVPLQPIKDLIENFDWA